MNQHTTVETEVLPGVERTKAMSMRRIGIMCDVIEVADRLWKGCPGDDKSLAAVVRYHHHNVNSLASPDRRLNVQEYIFSRARNGGATELSPIGHEDVAFGNRVTADASADLARFRKHYKEARA